MAPDGARAPAAPMVATAASRAAAPSASWIGSTSSRPAMKLMPRDLARTQPTTAASPPMKPMAATARPGRQKATVPHTTWKAPRSVKAITAWWCSAWAPMAAAWMAPAPMDAAPATARSRAPTVMGAAAADHRSPYGTELASAVVMSSSLQRQLAAVLAADVGVDVGAGHEREHLGHLVDQRLAALAEVEVVGDAPAVELVGPDGPEVALDGEDPFEPDRVGFVAADLGVAGRVAVLGERDADGADAGAVVVEGEPSFAGPDELVGEVPPGLVVVDARDPVGGGDGLGQ